MGVLWTLATLKDAAILEFGAMGHMMDARIGLEKAGLTRTAGLYSTHIDDIDVTLGGVERVTDAIDVIVRKDGVKAVFLLPSAVPEIIGTDFTTLVADIAPCYPSVDIIHFGFSGLTTEFNRGVRECLLTLVTKLAGDISADKKPYFNIIGSCADFMRFHGDADELVRIMRGAFGMEPRCILTSGASIDDIRAIGAAQINLVVRKEGVPAAEYLAERFGTRFLEDRPYGIKGTMKWIDDIAGLTGADPDKTFLDAEFREADRYYDMFEKLHRRSKFYGRSTLRISASGHSDVVKRLASFADELGFQRNRFWCNDPDGGTADIPYLSESGWETILPELNGDILMSSGDILTLCGRDQNMLLAHPHRLWSICIYDAPFMGFRGISGLINLWVHEIQKRS
jgi:nitrogenase molybdenum-iron protein alpha/beta subunit